MKRRPAEDNDDRARFALHNSPATKKPWHGKEPENTRQTMLLSGLECLPGQQDLFATDGQQQE